MRGQGGVAARAADDAAHYYHSSGPAVTSTADGLGASSLLPAGFF